MSESSENPFEVSVFVIYDEIFEQRLQKLPDNLTLALTNAELVSKSLYEKHVEKMLNTHLSHQEKTDVDKVSSSKSPQPQQ